MKIGDIVKLKSGGPRMTIVSIDEDYVVTRCMWFGTCDIIQGGPFPIEALEVIE